MAKAGRPSKLDDRQKAEIGRRLAQGETMGDLAKEYKIGKTTLSRHFSGRPEIIQNLANTLATTEAAIDQLPITEQISVRTLADQLKGLTNKLVATARIQSETASIMAGHGLKAAKSLPQNGATPEDMRTVAACTELANKAGQMGMGLLTAGKNFKPDDTSAPAIRVSREDECL